MTLTQNQSATFEKAVSQTSGELGLPLDEGQTLYLLKLISQDLRIIQRDLNNIPRVEEFFEVREPRVVDLPKTLDVRKIYEDLLDQSPDVDTYFSCLAFLYKSRLKYARVIEFQPLPTFDQVGPKTLLQYGDLHTHSLVALLLWRKWLYDLDNRAGQETGYLFEPIVANSIGGVPYPAIKSPIRRRTDRSKGRQVDCIKGKCAYEFKLRMTIAASGQGRWPEELDFPSDCRASGYTPILLVLDPTTNQKLSDLIEAFHQHGGQVYVGERAWRHLEEAAGPVMAVFLQKYVRKPLQDAITTLAPIPPPITFKLTGGEFIIEVEGNVVKYPRHDDETEEGLEG